MKSGKLIASLKSENFWQDHYQTIREVDIIGFTLKFDHIVHYVHQPEQVFKALEPYGISAIQGGRHEQIGTYNALSYFDLSYIEWIGVYDHSLLPLGDRTSRYGLIETLPKMDSRKGLAESHFVPMILKDLQRICAVKVLR